MSREVYVIRDGKLVLKHQAPPISHSAAIIPDFAESVKSMIDGKRYGSRSTYTRHIKDHGCEIVGNDFNNQSMDRPMQDVPGLVDDIKRAMGE